MSYESYDKDTHGHFPFSLLSARLDRVKVPPGLPGSFGGVHIQPLWR